MIQVDIDDREARELLNELKRRMADITPVLEAVGQVLQSGTQQRFIDQKAPDGTPWTALSAATIARRGAGAQILRDTGRLMNSISYKVTGESVTVFTNVIYSGTHQVGNPRRNIPARPFIGYNRDDNDAVLQVLNGYLQANQPLSWWQRLVAGIRRLFI